MCDEQARSGWVRRTRTARGSIQRPWAGWSSSGSAHRTRRRSARASWIETRAHRPGSSSTHQVSPRLAKPSRSTTSSASSREVGSLSAAWNTVSGCQPVSVRRRGPSTSSSSARRTVTVRSEVDASSGWGAAAKADGGSMSRTAATTFFGPAGARRAMASSGPRGESRRQVGFAEHVQHRGHPEGQRLPGRAGQQVDVRVDQTRQDGAAATVHVLVVGLAQTDVTDGVDEAAHHPDSGPSGQVRAVEDAHVRAGGCHVRRVKGDTVRESDFEDRRRAPLCQPGRQGIRSLGAGAAPLRRGADVVRWARVWGRARWAPKEHATKGSR